MIHLARMKNYHQETNKFKDLLKIMFDKIYLYTTQYEEDDDWRNMLDDAS